MESVYSKEAVLALFSGEFDDLTVAEFRARFPLPALPEQVPDLTDAPDCTCAPDGARATAHTPECERGIAIRAKYRPYDEPICESYVGLGQTGVRCGKPADHVNSPDGEERAHAHGTTRWTSKARG